MVGIITVSDVLQAFREVLGATTDGSVRIDLVEEESALNLPVAADCITDLGGTVQGVGTYLEPKGKRTCSTSDFVELTRTRSAQPCRPRATRSSACMAEGKAAMSCPAQRSDTYARLVQALSQPASYAPRPTHVERVQTHISTVFVADDLVYKLKKPLRASFLDYSTLALRQHYCQEEVRLNRRLAPKRLSRRRACVAAGGALLGRGKNAWATFGGCRGGRLPGQDAPAAR